MSDPVHITVAIGFGDGSSSLDVSHETAIVKAALLYADHVTLASPRMAMLATLSGILIASPDERAEIALQTVQVMPAGESIVKAVRELQRKRHKSTDDLFRLRDLQRQLRSSGDELAEKVEEILTQAGVAELAAAMSAGLVDLDPLGADQPDGLQRMVYCLTDLLGEMVAPGATTYPLLDETTSDLLRLMVKEGNDEAAVDLGGLTEPALAASWIGDLEAFPNAPIEAVLEAREGLAPALVRFRSAMVGISNEFESTPLDATFRREAAEAFRKQVAPRIQELEELAADDGVWELLKNAALDKDVRSHGGAVIGLLGATAASLPAIVGAAVGLTGDIGVSIVKRHQEIVARRRENAFVFLFDADRHLREF